MNEIHPVEWFKIVATIFGGIVTLGTILYNFFQREIKKIVHEVKQWSESELLKIRSSTDSKFHDLIKLNNEHVNDQVNEAHRRIDRVQAETNTLLKTNEVDMALLKYKSDATEEHLKSMESRIEKLDGKFDSMNEKINQMHNILARMNRGDGKD